MPIKLSTVLVLPNKAKPEWTKVFPNNLIASQKKAHKYTIQKYPASSKVNVWHTKLTKHAKKQENMSHNNR